MLTFFDAVALDDIDINDDAANFYLIQTDKTPGAERYKVCATTQDLSSPEMKFDPVTKIKEYWPITCDQLKRADLSLLFPSPDDKLRNEPLAITELDTVFRYDPKIPVDQNKAFHFNPKIPPEKFGQKPTEQSWGLASHSIDHTQRNISEHVRQAQHHDTQAVQAHFALTVGNSVAVRANRVKQPVSIVFILMFAFVAIARFISKREPIANVQNTLHASFFQPNIISRKQAYINERFQEQPDIARFQKDLSLFLEIAEKSEITTDDQNALNTFFKGLYDYEEGYFEYWDTPLMIAARHGNLELIDKLLVFGAKVNVLGRFKENALFAAVQKSNLAIIDRLLKSEVDLKAKNSNGQTVLIRAAKPEVVERLLTAGANIDTQDDQGWTPLMMAVFNGDFEVTEKLLEKGANIQIRNNFGENALMMANFSDEEIIRLLLQTARLQPTLADDEATFKEKQRVVAFGKGLFSLEDIEGMSKSAIFQLTHPACIQALENGDTQITILAEMTTSELQNANMVGLYPNNDSPQHR